MFRSLSSAQACLMPVEDVLRSLGVDSRHGLSISSDVIERKKQYGNNEFETEEVEPIWKKFIDKLKEPMIALLLASAGVSLATGQYDDAISISLVSTVLLFYGVRWGTAIFLGRCPMIDSGLETVCCTRTKHLVGCRGL